MWCLHGKLFVKEGLCDLKCYITERHKGSPDSSSYAHQVMVNQDLNNQTEACYVTNKYVQSMVSHAVHVSRCSILLT